jgi:hypothetical protein
LATKQEILAGINEVELRLGSLLPGILAHLDQPLPEGTWSVHDAVCHMAADANAVPRWLARIEAAEHGVSSRPPGFNIDDFNQQNIDARKDRPVEAVVQEIRDGLSADTEAIRSMDEGLLGKQIPNFRGELTPASDMLAFNTGRHNHMHLDDIERALQAAPSRA